MNSPVSNVDVFGNMLRIENQKAKMLENVSSLYGAITIVKEASNAEIADCAASVINSVYGLCRSLGVTDDELEVSLENCFKLNKYMVQ